MMTSSKVVSVICGRLLLDPFFEREVEGLRELFELFFLVLFAVLFFVLLLLVERLVRLVIRTSVP